MGNFEGSRASNGKQIHWFAQPNENDVFDIGLDNRNSEGDYKHDSHHIYGKGGSDIYNFTDFASLGGLTTGRLDTFDPTRDVIQIEGTPISMGGLPVTVNGIRVSVVEFKGQQWLRMQDGNTKTALFALEGARLAENTIADVNRGDRTGAEERHFYNVSLSEINNLPDVDYENPMNIVPENFYNPGSLVEVDGSFQTINGTSAGEMIFAEKYQGSGDRGSQIINAGGGHDVVQARSGNDVVYGGSGNDKIAGGIDDDILHGESGNDRLFGGTESDQLFGGNGRDTLDGGRDNDLISGGRDGDKVTGGEGEDIFTFGGGEIVRWGQVTGTWAQKYNKLDHIRDFVIGEDLIRFEVGSGVDDMSDLRMWKTTLNGDVHFTLQVRATNERLVINVDDNTQWGDLFDEDNFIFGNNTDIITGADMHAWGALNGNGTQKNAQLTVVDDFVIGQDQIRFTDSTGIDQLSDLQMWKTTIDGNVHFTIRERATNERILIDVADNTSFSQMNDSDNFIFG